MSGSVLLDLDGTLIGPGILASCLAALRALGHQPDEGLDLRRHIGSPLEPAVPGTEAMTAVTRTGGPQRSSASTVPFVAAVAAA